MRVILEAIVGPATGQRINLTRGYAVRVGKTSWADVSVSEDPDMADIHFSLEYVADRCVLRTVSSAETLVNGDATAECVLQPGDQVKAGKTTFRVVFQDADGRMISQAPSSDEDAQPEEEEPPSAMDYCDNLELSSDGQPLLEAKPTPEDLLDQLLGKNLWVDALRFCAHWLPKRTAIEWGVQCHRGRGQLPAAHDHALTVVEDWIGESTEENRRRAEAIAEEQEYSNAACWCAAGVFWHDGSIGPAEFGPVPPADHLTSLAIAASMALAGPAISPDQAKDFVKSAIEMEAAARESQDENAE
ncbi:MAG: FHA domain-containing protein [Planctomycetales bacterium]